MSLKTAALSVPTDVATFARQESKSPTFTESVKEGDNYRDSSLQFVFRAQLIP